MEQPESILASLPEVIALKIASCLQVGDLCALGSCSRSLRELCGSDSLWESLARRRWPSSDLRTESPSVDHGDSSSSKGWKDRYVERHAEMAERAMLVVQQVEQCLSSNSLETRDYLRAIERLNSMGLGFEDVEMFLFRPEVNVLLNLVGLHHCMHRLEVPAEHVMEALQNSKISQRQVCVKWRTPRRLLPHPRRRDGSDHTVHGSIALTYAGSLFRSRVVSLQDLALPQENEILSILRRGAIDEVSRV